MQIHILRSILKQLVTAARKLRITASTLPVLHHVKIEHQDDGYIIAEATNLDETLRLRLNDSPVAGTPGSVLVPFDELAALAKSGKKHDQITIAVLDATCISISDTIDDQSIDRTVDTVAVSEWPDCWQNAELH